jgi:flavin-dependent dehydrogenase
VFLGEEPHELGDEDLATIACRRPLVDAVLRSTLESRTSVAFRHGVVSGFEVDRRRKVPHVAGVRKSDGATICGDLVVDATGRNSMSGRWLAMEDVVPWMERVSESRLLYFSRHYRFNGPAMPYASLLGGPRGDLGFAGYAVHLGDNGTFCLCIMTPSWEKEWKSLRHVHVFDRVSRMLPGIRPWLEAAGPITDVLPMGQLRNVLRETVVADSPVLIGLVPISDAWCHTNPASGF